MFVTDMTFSEIFLFHYGWQGAALAAVLLLLLCIQLRYHLLAYGRIPAYRNNRRQPSLDSAPPLSVIVPMFAEDYLFIEERLPLLLAQEYSEFEIVLVYIGRDGDFFEDLQRIHQSIPRVTATKIEQDPRFPISTKMALNVGIKSVHYEHVIITTTDARPRSDHWLALMAKGFMRGDIVVGYCGVERKAGIANRWIRTDRMMDYVLLKDLRAACFEPAEPLSGSEYRNGIWYYRSSKDISENIYIEHLPQGTFVLEYPLYVARDGKYAGGMASIQCLYAPEFVSHTEGTTVVVPE